MYKRNEIQEIVQIKCFSRNVQITRDVIRKKTSSPDNSTSQTTRTSQMITNKRWTRIIYHQIIFYSDEEEDGRSKKMNHYKQKTQKKTRKIQTPFWNKNTASHEERKMFKTRRRQVFSLHMRGRFRETLRVVRYTRDRRKITHVLHHQCLCQSFLTFIWRKTKWRWTGIKHSKSAYEYGLCEKTLRERSQLDRAHAFKLAYNKLIDKMWSDINTNLFYWTYSIRAQQYP